MSSTRESVELLGELLIESNGTTSKRMSPISFGDIEVAINDTYFSETEIKKIFDASLLSAGDIQVLGSYSDIKNQLANPTGATPDPLVLSLMGRIEPFPQGLEFLVLKLLTTDTAFLQYVKNNKDGSNKVPEFDGSKKAKGEWPSGEWAKSVYKIHTGETSGAVGKGEMLLAVMFNLKGAVANTANVDLEPGQGSDKTDSYSVKSGDTAKVNNKYKPWLDTAWLKGAFTKLDIPPGEVRQSTIVESILKKVSEEKSENSSLNAEERCVALAKEAWDHMQTVMKTIITEKIILCNEKGWTVLDPRAEEQEIFLVGTDGRGKIELSPRPGGGSVWVALTSQASSWTKRLNAYLRHPTATKHRDDIEQYEDNVAKLRNAVRPGPKGKVRKGETPLPLTLITDQTDAMASTYNSIKNLMPYNSSAEFESFLKDIEKLIPNLSSEAAGKRKDIIRKYYTSNYDDEDKIKHLLSLFNPSRLPESVPPPSLSPKKESSAARGRNRTSRSEVSMGGVPGVTTPLGTDASGGKGGPGKRRGVRRGQSILDKNAATQGKNWGGAKPVNEGSNTSRSVGTYGYVFQDGGDMDGDGDFELNDSVEGFDGPIYRGGGGNLGKNAKEIGRHFCNAEVIRDTHELLQDLLSGKELTPAQTRRFKRSAYDS